MVERCVFGGTTSVSSGILEWLEEEPWFVKDALARR
jgi:hypothetical protein